MGLDAEESPIHPGLTARRGVGRNSHPILRKCSRLDVINKTAESGKSPGRGGGRRVRNGLLNLLLCSLF